MNEECMVLENDYFLNIFQNMTNIGNKKQNEKGRKKKNLCKVDRARLI